MLHQRHDATADYEHHEDAGSLLGVFAEAFDCEVEYAAPHERGAETADDEEYCAERYCGCLKHFGCVLSFYVGLLVELFLEVDFLPGLGVDVVFAPFEAGRVIFELFDGRSRQTYVCKDIFGLGVGIIDEFGHIDAACLGYHDGDEHKESAYTRHDKQLCAG